MKPPPALRKATPRSLPNRPSFPKAGNSVNPISKPRWPTRFPSPPTAPISISASPSPSQRPPVRYVRAVDIQPGNAKVVHHVILFEDTTGAARQRDTGSGYPCFGTPGFLPARGLGGWTPGSLPFQAPADIPETLEARATLVLQVHYHPDGKPETDQSPCRALFHLGPSQAPRDGYPPRLESDRHPRRRFRLQSHRPFHNARRH